MIAVDSSTLIAFIEGNSGPDIDQFDDALSAARVVLPPAVIAEVLSQHGLPHEHRKLVLGIPALPLTEGYWERTGSIRARLLSLKLRAYLADALIAQACIDSDVALITRDGDFRHFAKHCGLKLA